MSQLGLLLGGAIRALVGALRVGVAQAARPCEVAARSTAVERAGGAQQR